MITLTVDTNQEIGLEVEETVIGKSAKDYNNLLNKPKLNGQTIQGDISETDPTVPAWAKTEQKPTYNATEVGAISENDNISLQEIDNILNAIWG